MQTVSDAIQRLSKMDPETPVAMGIQEGRTFMIAVLLDVKVAKALSEAAAERAEK